MKHEVPTLASLHKAPGEAFEKDKLNILLNEEPPEKWVKSHPVIKVKNEAGQMVPLKYLSVDKVEYLLTRIFQMWHIEILSEGSLFNSLYVRLRLHYFNPYIGTAGEWKFMDGLGAAPAQSDSGQEFSIASIKAAAVQIGLPAAESYAFKDAASKIGRLFGRDLNRKYIMAFVGSFEEKKETKPNNNYSLKDLQL